MKRPHWNSWPLNLLLFISYFKSLTTKLYFFSAVILFVVEPVAYNICDQRFHEFEIRRLNPTVTVIRRTLTQLAEQSKLDGPEQRLLVWGIHFFVQFMLIIMLHQNLWKMLPCLPTEENMRSLLSTIGLDICLMHTPLKLNGMFAYWWRNHLLSNAPQSTIILQEQKRFELSMTLTHLDSYP